tara:strand:+ start:351 stop:608 length:258 start_codon:yes stop_codon:yes gene_type:complete
MVKERIKEIVEFANSESPYRSANKGWITNDIFLEWRKEKMDANEKEDQIVEISISSAPFDKLIFRLFLVLSSSLLFVLSINKIIQ